MSFKSTVIFMEDETIKQKLKQGVAVLVTALLLFGGSEYLEKDMLEDVYVCTSNERLYECTGNSAYSTPLSVTAKSCYGTDADGQDRKNLCRNGVFMPIVDYAKSKGVSVEDIIKGIMNENEPIQKQSGQGITSENCVPGGCTPN